MNYMWLIFALLSALSASFVAIFGKIGLQGIDSNTATAIRAVIMAIFLMIVIIIQGKFGDIGGILKNKKAITFIILSGVAGAMSWLFYFVALKLGDVSKVAPVDKLSVVFAIIFAFVLLGEKISLLGGFGVLLITAGVIIVALA